MPNYHAYYSEKQADMAGTNLYRLADGTEVECSMVGDAPPAWPDVVDLGPLATEGGIGSWVRAMRKGDGGYMRYER